MASEGEIYLANPSGSVVDVPQKRKGKKNTKKIEKLPENPAPSEMVSHPAPEFSDEEQQELPSNVTPGAEWIDKFKAAQQATNALRYHLCQVESKLTDFEGRILEENENIRKDLDDEEEARISLQK